MRTVWILGDQLNPTGGLLATSKPANTRVLFVVSTSMLSSRPWHRQRLHVVLASMRRLALQLEHDGYAVDFRVATSMRAGVRAHLEELGADQVSVMQPADLRLRRSLDLWPEVHVAPNDQFLCSSPEFAEWAATRGSKLRMEDFYRWQRVRLGVLMDGIHPVGGRWNFDDENREPPPKDGRAWPPFIPNETDPTDEVDAEISALIEQYAPLAVGDAWTGLWPTNAAQAHARLQVVIDEVLPRFGPHEDAMLRSSWLLAHTALSSSLNLGMLSARSVVDAAERAFRNGTVPLASAEGLIRQIIGWREYVYGIAHLWGADYAQRNELGADQPIPRAFHNPSETQMACVSNVVQGVDERAYAHHIQRLMVLGNLSLLAGVEPAALTGWMRERFIDGADWVMVPNVVGMALHADGGRMATKPYASGGAYIARMSDYCKGCRYDPKVRVGPKACPFTSLYWDFIARHEQRWSQNHRMSKPVAGMRRLADLPVVRERAAEVRSKLTSGDI